MSKKVAVDSVVYNLAGPEDKRTDYLKSLIFGAILHETSFGDTITQGYRNGPGVRFRNFNRWAQKSGFTDKVGTTSGSISAYPEVDDKLLEKYLPKEPNQTLKIDSVDRDYGDYEFWVNKYLAEKDPSLLGSDYSVDIDDENYITITYADGSQEGFRPENYDPLARYLYVVFSRTTGEIRGPVEREARILLGSNEDFPSTNGWNPLMGWKHSYHIAKLKKKTTTVKTYSDSRPPESQAVEIEVEEPYEAFHHIYEKIEFKGEDPSNNSIFSIRTILNLYQEARVFTQITTSTEKEIVDDDVEVTIRTIVEEEVLRLDRSYRYDTQKITHQTWHPPEYFIYKEGDGIKELDQLFTKSKSLGSFFPPIPVRHKKKNYTEDSPDYKDISRAFKYLTKGNYQELIKQLDDNEDIKNVNYAYITLGVSLNVKENACRLYIYNFFNYLLEHHSLTADKEYLRWLQQWNEAEEYKEKWLVWKDKLKKGEASFLDEPKYVPPPTIKWREVRIKSSKSKLINYDTSIRWINITKERGEGILINEEKKPARKGEVWLTLEVDTKIKREDNIGDPYDVPPPAYEEPYADVLVINYQESDNSWQKIRVIGAQYRNYVYKNKAITYSAREALEDKEESGFIIPLHEEIYQNMGLVEGTQMATACSFLVLNAYRIHKKKWYESGWFWFVAITLAVVVTIVTVGVFAPATLAGIGGLLGSNAAVGAALGFTAGTGLAATIGAIVGALVNTFAAMLLTFFLTEGSKTIFGEEWGGIIGSVVALVTTLGLTALVNSVDIANILSDASTLVNLGLSALEVGSDITLTLVSDYQNTQAQEIEALAEQARDIYRQYEKDFYNNLRIDPNMFLLYEKPDNFLKRTLMTGSDVVESMLKFISDFPEITLNLELV